MRHKIEPPLKINKRRIFTFLMLILIQFSSFSQNIKKDTLFAVFEICSYNNSKYPKCDYLNISMNSFRAIEIDSKQFKKSLYNKYAFFYYSQPYFKDSITYTDSIKELIMNNLNDSNTILVYSRRLKRGANRHYRSYKRANPKIAIEKFDGWKCFGYYKLEILFEKQEKYPDTPPKKIIKIEKITPINPPRNCYKLKKYH